MAQRNFTKSLNYAERSLQVFANATDGLPSHHVYLAQIYKAESLYQLDRIVESALVYQQLMTDIDNKVGTKTAVSKLAYSSWLEAKDILERENKTDEMKSAGILDYKVPETLSDGFYPLLRVPPIMPNTARRSGHVNIAFSVDSQGKVESPKIMSSTDPVFERYAIKSILNWRYPPDAPEDVRKHIESKITFRLYDKKGKIIPE